MIETRFASAERSPDSLVWNQYHNFAFYPVLSEFLNKIDQYVIVLNPNRQIVFCNKSFLNDYNLGTIEYVLGKRVGEAFDCRFAWCVAGCGTSEFCKECGAVQSIIRSQNEKSDVYMECVILTKTSKTIELGVTSKHMEIGGVPFTLFSFADISRDKQSKALEEIFFHDITGVASGIHSMLQLLQDDRIADKSKIQSQLVRCSSELLDGLQSHRILKAAERNDLQVNVSLENSLSVLDKAVKFVDRTQAARGNILYINHNSEDFDIQTDPALLNRVLVNMLTNALEASSFSQKVTVGCEICGDDRIFWVHNPGYIQPDIQAKIFRKTFSTKKRGSGLGTRSMRIITEGYLGGRVDFNSDQTDGTVFRIYLPERI